MRKLLLLLPLLFVTFTTFAQVDHSILIDENSFRAVQTDILTGVNIDPIGLDTSRQACARVKVKIERMSIDEIADLEIVVRSNNQIIKQKVSSYENLLIFELTAKQNTRFYFRHSTYGESNEVSLNLEGNREYEMVASLNQTFSIVVNSNVANAEVYLDGLYVGKTDNSNSLTIKNVVIGTHTLKQTYATISVERTIDVNSGSISFLQYVDTSTIKPQFVVFAVEPSSAVVTINNKHYPLQNGTMQVVLESGIYNYTVSAAGYFEQSGIITVAGSKVEKIVNLKADSANVTLSVPDNAEIWVNGVKKGTSNWRGTLVSGTYIFEARKNGHTTTSISKNITSEEPEQSYSLPVPTPITGSVVVTSTPAMADVYLDNKHIGRTPLELDNIVIGNHTLRISKSGYKEYSQMVTIVEGQTVNANTTLTTDSAYVGGYTMASYKHTKKSYNRGGFNVGLFFDMGIITYDESMFGVGAGLLWRLWRYNSTIIPMVGFRYLYGFNDTHSFGFPMTLNINYAKMFTKKGGAVYFGIGVEPSYRKVYGDGIIISLKGGKGKFVGWDYPIVVNWLGVSLRHFDVNMYSNFGFLTWGVWDDFVLGVRMTFLF